MTDSSASSPSGSWGTGLQRDLETEFQLEDQRVLYPLLDRLGEAAEALAEGKRVDPDYIREGIALWERYAAEVHSDRVQMLSRVFSPTPSGTRHPDVPKISPTFRRSKKSQSTAGPPPETAAEMFGQIQADQARMAERRGAFESLLRDYASEQYWAREMLAGLLRSSAFSDRAWAHYEEDFVRDHFNAHIDSDTERRMTEDLRQFRERRTVLESDVRRFLDSPVRLRPPVEHD